MRRILGLVAIAALVVFGFQLLKETTEYHGGVGKHGAQTTVTFHISTKRYHSDDVAAAALWQVCLANVGWTSNDPPIPVGANVYRAAIRPSLASDTKRRLSGCLNEATLDRVEGHVRSIVDGP